MFDVLNSSPIELAMINIRICTCFFISIILFFVAYKVSRKPKIVKKSKEYKGVISPILAEVLVDGKIDIKNLILTTITELQIKKNVAIVNDNIIELLHKNNLSIHELYLVDMIFLDKKSVTFNEINDRFIYAKFSTANFVESMSKISNEIQTKLYETNIFSKKRMIILNLASYLAMLIIINLPIIILNAGFSKYVSFFVFSITFSLVASAIFFSRLLAKGDIVDLLKMDFTSKTNGIIIFGSIIFIECILLVVILNFKLFSILGIFGVYFMSFITFKMAKNNVLSDKGLEERRKVIELKNFLETHDLRKTEGQETYIVWNEYFAYAAAFGISNPVISEIYKLWNKLDMSLSFTKNLI